MRNSFIDLTQSLQDYHGKDCHAIIQGALCGGHRTVKLPPGRFFVSKTLRITSHTCIEAHEHTVISLAAQSAQKQEDYLLTNADPIRGNEKIEIMGGIWDGNGAHNPRGEDQYEAGAFGGVAINFIKVKDLRMSHLTAANSDCFFIRLGEIDGFRIEDVKLFNTLPRINQDGVHIGGFCRNGAIVGLHAISPMTPGDDLVALNADDDVERHMNKGMRLGPIENIEIRDLSAESAYTFVRLLSQNQSIRNVRISELRGGVRNNGINMNRWRFPVGGGKITDVRIRDVRLHKMPWSIDSAKIQPEPIFDLDLKASDLEIENFTRPPLDGGVGDTLRVRIQTDCQVGFSGENENATLVKDGEFLRMSGGGFRHLSLR